MEAGIQAVTEGQEISPQSNGIFIDVDFALDAENKVVTAVLAESKSDPQLNIESLQQRLANKSFSNLHMRPAALKNLVEQINEGVTGQVEIADIQESPMRVTVSDDKMYAYLSLNIAEGQSAVDSTAILQELQSLEILQEWIKQDVISKVCAEQKAESICIAEAQPAKKGRDTSFEALQDGFSDSAPKIDDQGNADQKNLYEFIVVDKGTELMKRNPPRPGVDGKDLFGNVVEAEPVNDEPFDTSGEGISISPENPDVLIAEIKGHPIYRKCGVRVDPVLKVPAVNLRSGNIDFDGSVKVDGDVTPGFIVHATGDVVVGGIVESARIHAGQNITVKGGVIGSDTRSAPIDPDNKNMAGNADEGDFSTILVADGSIEAKFVNMSYLAAEEDLRVSDSIFQSKLNIGNEVFLGQQGGKGILVGGSARVGKFMSANVVGSDANVRTTIKVGQAKSLEDKLERLTEELDLNTGQVLKLSKVHKSLASALGDPATIKAKRDKIATAIEGLREKMKVLTEEVDLLRVQLEEANTAGVFVKKLTYPNVILEINRASCVIREETKTATFLAQGKKIKAEENSQ